MGHQIIKLNQDGEVLMRLGEAGVRGMMQSISTGLLPC